MGDAEERRVEDLIGRRVLAPDGGVAGRIEEMRAVREGNYFVVSEFHIGPAALLERMAVRHLGWAIFPRAGYKVRWDQIDLTDPRRPRLVCAVAELTRTRAAG